MKRTGLLAAVAVAGLALTGCASTGTMGTTPAKPSSPHTLTAAEMKVVEEGVRSSLKDPTSPIFGRMAAAFTEGSVAVCGYVNAKNSFGGYVGDQPYFGLLAGEPAFHFGVVSMGGTDTDTLVTFEMCRRYGVSL